jgi:peptide/nickel transport system substrate-binding protein
MARSTAPESGTSRRVLRALSFAALAVFALPGCGESEGSAGATTTASSTAVNTRGAPRTEWGRRVAAMEEKAELMGGGVTAEDLAGAHPLSQDTFRDDGNQDAIPALGGRVIMHVASQPASLNYTLSNSWSTTTMLNEMHDSLLNYNWETWEQDLELAARMDIEDTLILKGGRSEDNGNIIYGRVQEFPEHYLVASGSVENPIEEQRIAKADVESIQRGTVFTFELREGVTWHDGHAFDAADVLFSWDVFNNPVVDCDESRFRFNRIGHGEVLGPLTVRFFYDEQYFQAKQTFNNTLCILPRHLYDLTDSDNADYDPTADLAARGTYINDNRHNHEWVGLGPYKLVDWRQDEYVEATRNDNYYIADPATRGYLDILRWRFIKDDELTYQALLNSEIDTFNRVKTIDFFGDKTQSEDFTKLFNKTYTYAGQFGYTGWNMYSPKLSDVRVRTALAHAFDGQGWINVQYKGLAVQVTGSQFFIGPGYNHDVKPLAYDPALAEQMLLEAGWYDHNGDGIADKDGVELVIEWLMPSGNSASRDTGQRMQESFAKIGVKLDIQALEWASFLERILDRKFEGCNLAWVLEGLTSDPTQLWHSSNGAEEKRSSNHSGYMDAESDELIDAIVTELDDEKRHALFQKLHERIYSLQPYLFSQNPPVKIAFNKDIHGIKLYHFTPGFRLRDMYYEEGTPGTRPIEE